MHHQQYPLSKLIKHNSAIAFGCMGLGGSWDTNPITRENITHAHNTIDAALDAGITFFDHADIYTRGKAEQVFGEVLKQRPELTEQICLQSKCAIRFPDEQNPQQYDFSPNWITQSVESSLKRLNTQQLDILLLHRPDPLMEPELIAETFNQLQQSGKVKHFGVSNMQQHQMAFLQSSLSQPLVVNQIELSLSHRAWIEEGITTGNSGESLANFGAGTLEYCQLNKVQLQSWGSLSQGMFTGADLKQQPQAVQQTAQLVSSLAAEYQVSPEAIVLAWLMRHPANIQPIIGTTNPQRIKNCVEAQNIRLSRSHWYQLWITARGRPLP